MAKNNVMTGNRQVTDVLFTRLSDGKQFFYADFCNSTNLSFSGDSVYANKKGSKAISWANPMDTTFSLTFSVAPFRVYSFFSNGEISETADVVVKETVKGEASGKLTLKETPVANSVSVYAKGDIGGKEIAGSVSTKSFTASSTSEIVAGTEYDVVYTTTKQSGVQKIEIKNATNLVDYKVQFSTIDKTESGAYVGKKYTIYKASIQRNLEMTFSSDGDPQEITINFDALEDSNGNLVDFIMLDDSTL